MKVLWKEVIKPSLGIKPTYEKKKSLKEEWAPDGQIHDSLKFSDPVNHPSHYTGHPCGMEVIEITKHETFCIGNAIKYLMRYKLKGNPRQDLEKAVWYINKELEFDALRDT